MCTFSASGVSHRRGLILVLLLTILPAFIFFFLGVDIQSRGRIIHPEPAQHPTRTRGGVHEFGDAGKHLNFSNHDNEIPLARRAIPADYDAYVCKGNVALDMITNKAPSTRIWTQQDIDNAWRIRGVAGRTSIDLDTPMNELGIPHSERDVQAYFADQNVP